MHEFASQSIGRMDVQPVDAAGVSQVAKAFQARPLQGPRCCGHHLER